MSGATIPQPTSSSNTSVPAEKRTYAGLDKCRRCMDTYGPKAACNWQPLVRIAPNLYQAQPCHDCVRYPDVFEEDCCSLNKRLYVYDGDYNRILRLAKKGNVAESQSSEAEEPATLATHSSQPPRSYRRLSDR